MQMKWHKTLVIIHYLTYFYIKNMLIIDFSTSAPSQIVNLACPDI